MSKRVFIAGHQGMVGSAIARRLADEGNVELVVKPRRSLDLLDQKSVQHFFEEQSIDEVYVAAARVGGIHANDHYPATFIYENLMLQCNIINSAYRNGVTKLLFLGSSCIYPRLASQPMKESELLGGALEPTNEPYAIAKIAGIKLCESYNRQYSVDFRSVMPTNLYGDNDNFHPENAHVIPAMMQRFHAAKVNQDSAVEVWGSGKPRREFLHVEDMASACVHIMELPADQYQAISSPRLSHINIGTGSDCSIRELAETMCEVVGFSGEINFDESKPDGAPQKLLDITRLSESGFKASIPLKSGLQKTYQWYLQNQQSVRGSNYRHALDEAG